MTFLQIPTPRKNRSNGAVFFSKNDERKREVRRLYKFKSSMSVNLPIRIHQKMSNGWAFKRLYRSNFKLIGFIVFFSIFPSFVISSTFRDGKELGHSTLTFFVYLPTYCENDHFQGKK